MSGTTSKGAELPTKTVTETLNPGTTVHPTGNLPVPVNFTIGLESFAITNTRAFHEDTDFVTVSLAIGNHAPQSLTRSLGKKNNGNFPLNMDFTHQSILPGQSAVLTYTMVNAGHKDPGTVETELKKTSESLAQKAAGLATKFAGAALGKALGEAIGSAIVPLIGTALGALAGYVVDSVFAILTADCDGPVAAAVHVFTYDQIKAIVDHNSTQIHTDDHPGVDSATGCGSNSHYTVTWFLKK